MYNCIICNREGSHNIINNERYCDRHYMQIKRHGQIQERTRWDKNEIIIHADYAEVVLYNKKSQEVAKTKIDIEDIEKVKKYKWCLKESNCNMHYVVTTISKNRKIQLHRYVTNVPDDKYIDHINHDTLDNRKVNLRICSHQENMMHRQKPPNNTSGVIGVSWSELHKHWQAQIEFKETHIHLGWYKNKDDAIQARKKAEEKYFKEFKPNQEDKNDN